MAIITRGEKGKPLTHAELDNNFIEIRNSLGQTTPSNVSSFQAYIYQRSAVKPEAPEGGSYNFIQGAFQELPYGWYASIPNGTAPVYSSSTLFITSNISTPTEAGLWTSPVLISAGGDEQTSVNRSIVYCYKRSAEEPPIDDRPTGDVIISLSGDNYGQITSPVGDLGSGWFKDIQAANNLPLYLRAASAADVDRDGIDSIATGEWTEPILFVQDGENGINARTIFLYARSSGYPIDSVDLVEFNQIPEVTVTYNFESKDIAIEDGDPSGWGTGIPEYSANSGYLYVCQATAASSSTEDIIQASEFSNAELLVQDGSQGENAIQYYLSTDSNIIRRDSDGNLEPNSLTFEAYYISGLNDPISYSDGFIEYSGISGSLVYDISGFSGASLNYNPINTSITRVIARLKPESGSATTYSTLNIPVVSDGQDGQDGLDADIAPINLANSNILSLAGVGIDTVDNFYSDPFTNLSGTSDITGSVLIAAFTGGSTRYIQTNRKINLFGYDKVYIYANKGGGSYFSINTDLKIQYKTGEDAFTDISDQIGLIDVTGIANNNEWVKLYYDIPQEAKDSNGVYLRIGQYNVFGGDSNDVVLVSSLFFNTLGDPGPGLVYRGDYDVAEKYYYSDIRRDVVRYSNVYYITNNPTKDNETNWGTPDTATDDWIEFSDTFESVATKLLLAEDATITKTLTLGGDAEGTGTLRSSNATYTTTQATGYKGTGFFLNSSGDFFVGSGNTDDFTGNYLFFDSDQSDLTLRVNDLVVGNSNNGSGMVFLQKQYGTAPFNLFDDNTLYIGQGAKLSSKAGFTFGGGGTFYNFGELELGTDVTQTQSFGSGTIKLGFSEKAGSYSDYAVPSLYLSGVFFENSISQYDYLLTDTGTNDVLYQTYGQTGTDGNWVVSQYRNTFTQGDYTGNYGIYINSNPEFGGIAITNKEGTFNNLIIPNNRGSVSSRNNINAREFTINNFAVIDFDFEDNYISQKNSNIYYGYEIPGFESLSEAEIFSNTKLGFLSLTGNSSDYTESFIQTKDKVYLTGARSGYFYYNVLNENLTAGDFNISFQSHTGFDFSPSLNTEILFNKNFSYNEETGKWNKVLFEIPEESKGESGVYLKYRIYDSSNNTEVKAIFSNFYIDAYTGNNPRKVGKIQFDQTYGEFKLDSTNGTNTSVSVDSLNSRREISSSSIEIDNNAVIDFNFPERYNFIDDGNIDFLVNVTGDNYVSGIYEYPEADIFYNTRIGLLTGGTASEIVQVGTKNKVYLTGSEKGSFYYYIEDSSYNGTFTLLYGLDSNYSASDSIFSNNTSNLTKDKWRKASFKIPEEAKNPNGVYLKFLVANQFASSPDIAVSNLYIDSYTGENTDRKVGAIRFDQNGGEFKMENTDGSPTSLLVSGYKTYTGESIFTGVNADFDLFGRPVGGTTAYYRFKFRNGLLIETGLP